MKKCRSCKAEIPNDASKCSHCGSSQHGWFRRHYILTGIMVFFLIGIIGNALGMGKNSQYVPKTEKMYQSMQATTQLEPTVTPTEAPKAIVVDAVTLVKEYDKNKLAAQDKYTGKLVQTTAYIDNISEDVLGSYFLSLKPSNDQYYFGTSIQCYFKDKKALTSLSKGQEATVMGKMKDMSLGIVVMDDCSLSK